MGGTVQSANLRSAASAIALKGAEASAAAYAVALGSAISGSIGLAPAVFGGAEIAVRAFELGISGLSSAWKALGQQSAASGPSAAQQARQQATAMREVTSAQEALATAQRDALSAQKAISDAEETAAKNIRDLSIAARDAKLDEQSATLAVADAQKAVVAARESGNAEDILRANIAYQQSADDLETAKNKTSDLAEENDKAAKAGVAGSDAVLSAQQKLADSTQAVADATSRLADARVNLNTGSGGGAASNAAALAMAKLSVNGRALLMTLKDISPAWSGVQRNLQNKMFAGVSGDVRSLSDKYLPVLNGRLGDMGKAFNAGIRASLGLLGTKQSVGDVNTIMTNLAKGTRELGTAIAPVIGGLLGLGAAGSNFLPKLFGWVHGLAVEFANWVTEARKSGQLATWLNTAENALHSVWIIAGNVAGIIGAIFRGGGADAGGNLLGSIVKLTTNLRTFLDSTKGQADIEKFFGGLRDIIGTVVKVLPGAAGGTGLFKDSLSIAAPIAHLVATHISTLVKYLPLLAAGYGIAKTAQSLKIIRDIIHLPILAASAIANWRLASAMKAQAKNADAASAATERQTPKMAANTVATDAQGLSTEATGLAADETAVSTDAMTLATEGQTGATETATVAQEGLNTAFFLSPVGLVVIAIVALIAIFVLLWVKCKWFRDFWEGLWKDIQNLFGDAVSFVKDHWQLIVGILTGPIGIAVLLIKDHFGQIVDFFGSIGGKIAKVAVGMWDGIKNSFRGAIDWILKGWNKLNFKIPSFHFMGISSPAFSLGLPQIPLLAQGGVIKHSPGGTLLVAGEGREDEVVAPLSKLSGIGAGSGGKHDCSVTLVIDSGGSEMDALILKIIRKAVRAQGGNGRALAIKTVG